MTSPPARKACASSLSSAAAARGAAPSTPQRPPASTSIAIARRERSFTGRPSHQEDALAGGLGVEQFVGLLGLVEPPAVGEEGLDVDPAVGDELRAFGLAHLREGPG